MTGEYSTDTISYTLYFLGYAASMLGFMMTRIEWLRLLFILSSTAYALYYYITPVEPLWLDVISEGSFVVVNLFMLAFVYYKTFRTQLTEQEQHLFDSHFSQLRVYEFAELLKNAEWKIFEPGTVLIDDESPVDRIYCLFSGEAKVVTRDGQSIIRRSGSILGELSYQLDAPSQGTVIVKDRSVCISWDQTKLRKLCRHNKAIGAAINTLLTREMARKLGA